MPEPTLPIHDQNYSVEQDDAVCFSAGLTGAPFGAGAIHAYLASDRQPPKIAAGISLGALNAAVMERCYRDMETCRASHKPRSEAARWGWYRRYLAYLLNRPFDVVWDAIPDPSDLIADLPPVQQTDLPVDEDGNTVKIAERLEIESRRKLYIVSKFGSWLAHLPIRVSSLAWLVVRYVRAMEKYPKNVFQLWNIFCLQVNSLVILWRLLLHAARPFWLVERWFRFDRKQIREGLWFRPLFGWELWGIAAFLCLAMLSLSFWNAIKFVVEYAAGEDYHLHHVGWAALFIILPLIPVWGYWLRGRVQKLWATAPTADEGTATRGDRILRRVLVNLDIERSLLSDFPLLMKLFRLFEEKGHSPKLKDCRFPVLLVAAPLQVLPSSSGSLASDDGPNQLWPKPRGELSIVRALRACLSIAPWFRSWNAGTDPDNVLVDPIKEWVSDPAMVQRLDLVDGAAVRHNPLPALFRYLKDNRQVADALNGANARVHLIYDVPIRWKQAPPFVSDDLQKSEPRLPNIVETGFDGMRLAHRRDSRLEVVRTNFLTEIERHLRAATDLQTVPPVHTIQVNEIAPDDDLRLENELNPKETELLTHIAAGCRQTLSVLYASEIQPSTQCPQFLRGRARNRRWQEVNADGLPGLAEVCRHCTRILNPPPPPPTKLLPACFTGGRGDLIDRFPELSGTRPRLIFLASGGVFRGSFHIGMLGAMLALDLKPDLIVGASVGTLMGAVLGSTFKTKAAAGEEAARAKLQQLANLFIRVDELVALTKTFKGAAKDLGIRGRSDSLKLSPNDLRKMVKRGSREDAGIAATGAPPALIDAISDLFLIPYHETAKIAANFVAGHFSDAIKGFWDQISTETIDRLGVYEAVLAANLIEREIRKLLKDDLVEGRDHASAQIAMQPFLDNGTAFFATTVNVVTEAITTLGAELDCTSYDMMEALLASSAFPAAFAPRRASSLYPGIGRRDIFYGDGGMFDNLPALPAFEVLAEVQKDRLRTTLGQGRWREELTQRYDHPDLILVGSLNRRQKADRDVDYSSMLKAFTRAARLADNEKIQGLERASIKIDKMLKCVSKNPRPEDKAAPREAEQFLNGLVNAAVVPVYPSDEAHLNGTFNFCTSLGLDRDRVRRSIAGGCFQTMATLYEGQQKNPETLVGRSLAGSRVPKIILQDRKTDGCLCPYFQTSAGDLPCPFETADQIHVTCSKDKTHRAQFVQLGKPN